MRKLNSDNAVNHNRGGHTAFEFDAAQKKAFLDGLKKNEDQIEGMLLWSSIIVLVSYLAVMITVIKYYISFEAGNPLYLTGTIMLALFLFGAFIWLQYRVTAYRPAGGNLLLKELLNFKTYIAHRQISLLKTFITAYSVMVGGLCILCGYYTGHAQKILQATVPLSIMVYGAGLFLLFKLTYKRKKYLNYTKTIDDNLINEFSRQ